MKLDELIRRYIDAWNRRDLASMLDLLHPGAAYYDALWMESCVGRHLPKMLQESLDEEQYWYQMLGEPIEIEDGGVYRYAAFDLDGSEIGKRRFEGAEVLTVRDGKILTISDHYSDPDPMVLTEVARLAVLRHGLPAFVSAGHSAYKSVHVKNRLLQLMTSDKIYHDRTLTVVDLAEQLGCTVDHLLTLVNAEFGTDVKEFVDRPGTTYVADLLRRN